MNNYLGRKVDKILSTPIPVLFEVLAFKSKRILLSVYQRLLYQILHFSVTSGKHGIEVKNDISFFCFPEIEANKSKYLDTIFKLFPHSKKEYISSAKLVCEHKFDLLGSGKIGFGEKIEWQKDFKSGYKWERRYFKNIRQINLENNSDIKVPWELNRFYHFIELGKAYFYTSDEKYTKEYLKQFEEWIEENRPYYGVNWHCSMEVAIRAVNWIWAYFLFRKSKLISRKFRNSYAKWLYMHGHYIFNNLEFDKRVVEKNYSRMNGNHYISDIIGLIYLGIVLPGRGPTKWLKTGLSELQQEIEIQILDDGVHWELAPSYHRLVLEMLISVLILCNQNNISFKSGIIEKIKKMFFFCNAYLYQNGTTPLIRDADDGRFVILSHNNYRDHRNLLTIGAIFFENSELLPVQESYGEDFIWLLGCKGFDILRSLRKKDKKKESKAFSEGGFYFSKSKNNLDITISCAGTGMKGHYGGHSHSDSLSFEIFWKNRIFVTDCGTYCYSMDKSWRNKFRSTEYHNTARIDNKEICNFPENILFAMENTASPRVIEWSDSVDRDILCAEHIGYTRLINPISHKRRFTIDKIENIVTIDDDFLGSGIHLFEVFINLHPEIELIKLEDMIYYLDGGDACIIIKFVDGQIWKSDVKEGWVSERYGIKKKNKKIVVSASQNSPCSLKTVFLCQEKGSIKKKKFLNIIK